MSSEDPDPETLIELICKKDLEILWAIVAPGEPLPRDPHVFVERIQFRMLQVSTLESRSNTWLRLSGERHQQLLASEHECARLRAHAGGLEDALAAVTTLCKDHKLL
jgi:predicted exporter